MFNEQLFLTTIITMAFMMEQSNTIANEQKMSTDAYKCRCVCVHSSVCRWEEDCLLPVLIINPPRVLVGTLGSFIICQQLMDDLQRKRRPWVTSMHWHCFVCLCIDAYINTHKRDLGPFWVCPLYHLNIFQQCIMQCFFQKLMAWNTCMYHKYKVSMMYVS